MDNFFHENAALKHFLGGILADSHFSVLKGESNV